MEHKFNPSCHPAGSLSALSLASPGSSFLLILLLLMGFLFFLLSPSLFFSFFLSYLLHVVFFPSNGALISLWN